MKSRFASTTVIFFLLFSIVSLLDFVRANNGSDPDTSFVQCPPPPPCICTPTSPLLPPPNDQPPPSPSNAQPLPPPAATPQPPPITQPSLPPPSQQTTPPPPHITLPLPPPNVLSPPPPPPTPSSSGICIRNDTDLQICANIVSIADGLLTTGRAEPCCSIIRNLSDVDAVTCLCKSVGARPFSLSPNFGIFFRVCGRRIPPGFTCPGPSPTIPQPPLNVQSSPPPQTTPPPPPTLSSGGICTRNDTDLKICANIVSIADGLLTTGRAEPCCSIVRNLSDVDAVTCLCKSVGAKPFSLSPNFGIFFRVCGRRIPPGFSCPGPSPTIPQSPPNAQPPPPPQTTPLPPPTPSSGGICTRNDTDLQICANIVSTADGLLTTGRAEPCCSIIRNLSDFDAVTCLCKSVGARPFSLSPNFGIFFRVCGRRIPQGFSCP